MLMTVQRCRTRSGMAEAMVTSAKTTFYWEKVLLEVKTVVQGLSDMVNSLIQQFVQPRAQQIQFLCAATQKKVQKKNGFGGGGK